MSPNPGSPEAIKAGCTCPVMDNRRGQGVLSGDPPNQEMSEAPKFWNLTCHLPRGWRLALLKALAWPEYRVYHVTLEAGPTVVERAL